jgi:hypothetical protein
MREQSIKEKEREGGREGGVGQLERKKGKGKEKREGGLERWGQGF